MADKNYLLVTKSDNTIVDTFVVNSDDVDDQGIAPFMQDELFVGKFLVDEETLTTNPYQFFSGKLVDPSSEKEIVTDSNGQKYWQYKEQFFPSWNKNSDGLWVTSTSIPEINFDTHHKYWDEETQDWAVVEFNEE